MARYDNICSYFDIPVQHASDTVLSAMGRRYGGDDLRRLFGAIRSRLPGAALRTTVLTGFPGETDADFHRLLDFVHEIRFDHLGVFMYSDNEDLASHRLGGHVPPDVARERCDRLMEVQQGISAEIGRRHIGAEMKILVENILEEGLCQGRSVYQAPEVDGVTLIEVVPGQNEVKPGAFTEVRIIDALDYDLMGVAV